VTEAVERDSHFAGIKNAILKEKDKSTFEKSDDVVTLSFSGLIYSVTASKEESISFKALDLDFIIKPEGEIMMMELEGEEVNFYEIQEGALKDNLRGFLSWRTTVLETTGL
jgi:hypothetical protein